MNPERSIKVVAELVGACKGLRLYPLNHPAVEAMIQGLTNSLAPLFSEDRVIRLGLHEGALFLGDQLFADGHPAAEEMAGLLENLELAGLEFLPPVTAGEIRILVGMLQEGLHRGEDFGAALTDRGVYHIRTFAPQPEENPGGDEKPRLIYAKALEVVDQIFQDVRLGKIPTSDDARAVVKSMVRVTLAEPHALFALSMLRDYDNYTFHHSVNVSVIALTVGRACGLPEGRLRLLGLGGLLHDVGKLIIDREIINKPGRLTEKEFEEIKKHPNSGSDIVRRMEGVTQEVVDVVLCHHLRYDRQGYPANERGREISSLADMAAIADTYDAMTTLRSYQRPLTPRKAAAGLRKLSGKYLHPRFVEQFIAALGPYPVGSLVRLDSNEIGLVVKVDSSASDAVELKMLFDEVGNFLQEPVARRLSRQEAGRIVAEIEPQSRGIEISDYFE